MIMQEPSAQGLGRDEIVGRVQREIRRECPPDQWAPWLDRCAEDAVDAIWGGSVKAFVPLLAIRHVRCCLRAGTCDCGEC